MSHAVIIGGSIAGLLAAKALSRHVTTVTIIERDHLPEDARPRGGTPQARHLHVLLERGQKAIRRLIPELDDDLTRIGAPRLEWGVNNRLVTPYGDGPRFDSGIRTNMVTRLALENIIRQRVRQVPNIGFRTGWLATGLVAQGDERVRGVTLEARRSRETAELHADLVVDASGRTSDAPEWLARLCYERPRETVIDAFVGYSTLWLERPADAPTDWVTMTVSGGAEYGFRNGIIYTVENDVWNVILTGINGDYPPTDYDKFLAWSRTLPTQDFHDLIARAKPLSPVLGYRRTNNVWRHYEEMRLPHNFILTGDAAVSFNPVYGQGMSAAALHAEALDNLLPRQPFTRDGFSRAFQKRVAQLVANPWQMATSYDVRHPLTLGYRPPRSGVERFFHRYGQRIELALADDVEVNRVFYEVMHMRRSPAAYFSPHIVWRVLRRRQALPVPRYFNGIPPRASTPMPAAT